MGSTAHQNRSVSYSVWHGPVGVDATGVLITPIRGLLVNRHGPHLLTFSVVVNLFSGTQLTYRFADTFDRAQTNRIVTAHDHDSF